MTVETIIHKEPRKRTARSALLNQMVRTVRQRALFAPGQRLLVAVSGGPDSMALLSLLRELSPSWHLTLNAVHFNYGLRGEESDADESFVRRWCGEWGIPFILRRPVMSKRQGASSLQAAAREVRYSAMKQLARELGADRIVVGHTANDQAETMLMWMLRGAGLTGLAGMPYVREGIIVRPLLASTREDVLAYLVQRGVPYRHDTSNDKPLYLRNRIRKELMPVLMRLKPAAVHVLRRQAEMLRDDDVYLEQIVDDIASSLVSEDEAGRQRYDRRGIATLPVALQRRVIRQAVQRSDAQKQAPSLRVVESVRQFLEKGRPGARLMLRAGLLILKSNYAELYRHQGRRLTERPAADRGSIDACHVKIPSVVDWGRRNYRIQVQLMTREEAERLPLVPPGQRALFDAQTFSEPLVLRSWRAGDRLQPKGMKGRTKKLQDLFTDLKIEREDRRDIPILVAAEGILWVIGTREDQRFGVRDSTTRCLSVTVIRKGEEEGAG